VRRNALLFAALLIAIVGMLSAGKYLNRVHRHSPTKMVGDVRGLAAPNFDLATLDGRRVKLSDYRGKAVLLNFWATWCSPCKVEMPWFVELQKKYGNDGLVILGIAMDDSDAPKIAQFANEMGVNYPVLLGTDQVSEQYGNVEFLPTSFYIDRDGKIVGKGTGLLARSEIEDNVRKALASPVATMNNAKTSASAPKTQPTSQ
jgi:thiol-disulfide isomerase/thioredoxin